MRFAITFGMKYDRELHPASDKITGKSYVVFYSDPVLDPNPALLSDGDGSLGDAVYSAEVEVRNKVLKVLGGNNYAFIYPFDKKYKDEFSHQIEAYDLTEVQLDGNT